MKSFENEIKKRVLIQTIKAVAIVVFVFITFTIKAYLNGSTEAVSDVERHILIGLFAGGEVTSISAILKYRKALKNPVMLEELQISEKDERNKILTLKTCRSTMNMTCMLLGFAGIIASFFNLTVLMTISVVLIVILTLYTVLRIYYSRKL